MARVLSVCLVYLLPPPLDLFLGQILIFIGPVKQVHLVGYTSSHIGREEEVLLFEVIFRFLNLKRIIDHLDLYRKRFFFHAEVAYREPPLSAFHHKGVALLVEVPREVLNIPGEGRIHAILVLLLDYLGLTLYDLEAFLFEELEDRVTLPHFHEGVKEYRVIVREVGPIELYTTLNDFFDDGRFQNGKHLTSLLFEQVLNVARRVIQAVAEKLEPEPFLILVRGLRLQVFLEDLPLLLLLCCQLVIGHLREEYDVFPVKHGHDDL
jgi:hypothetical protein